MEKGEFVAVAGYSGARRPHLADRRFDQPPSLRSMIRKSPNRGRIAASSSNYSLLPWLTVYENIFLAVEQIFPNRARRKSNNTSRANRDGELTPRATNGPANFPAACASA
jgi:nitrate/nitrite transport system ATP-binding protein